MKSSEDNSWRIFRKYELIFYIVFTVTTFYYFKINQFHGVHDTNYYLGMSSFYLQALYLENWFPVWSPNYMYGIPTTVFNFFATGPEFNIGLFIYKVFNLNNLLNYYYIYATLTYLISFIFIMKLFKLLKINFLLSLLFSLLFFINIFPFVDPEFDMRIKLIMPIVIYICFKLVLDYSLMNLLIFLSVNSIYIPFGRVPYTTIIIYYFEIFLILTLLIFFRSEIKGKIFLLMNRNLFRMIIIDKFKLRKNRFSICLLLFLTITSITYLFTSIYIFQEEIQLNIPGRQSSKASFEDFVYWGGFFGKEKLLNLLFVSIEPIPHLINYYTSNTFLGILPLSLMVLFITNYRTLNSFLKKIVKVLISNCILILLFTLPSITFLKILFQFPGMSLVRHTSYYFSSISFIIILMSAVLFNNLYNQKYTFQYYLLFLLLTYTVANSTKIFQSTLAYSIAFVLFLVYWKFKNTLIKRRVKLLCLLILILNLNITIQDIARNYPFNNIKTNFINTNYYTLKYDLFSEKRYSSKDPIVLSKISFASELWGAQYATKILINNLDVCDTELRNDFLTKNVSDLFKEGYLPASCSISKFKLFKLIDNEEIDFTQDLFISDLIIKANSVTFNYNIDNFDTKFSYRIEYQDSNSTMWKIRINNEPRSYLVDYGFKSFSPIGKSGFVEMNINLFYLFVYTIGNLNFIVFYALIIFSAIYLPRYSDLQNSLKSNSNNN